MSKPLKPRRGTTAGNNAFVGEAYEVTYDTDKNTLVCRDGLTAGGFPLAKEGEVATQLSSLDTALRALIAEEFAKCLKKTGSTMTGALSLVEGNNLITYSDDKAYGYKFVLCQAGEWGKGTRIQMMREDSPNDPGVLALIAGNAAFRIEPDERVSIAGSQVLLPAGSVFAFAANSTPAGCLLCNGAAVSRTTYAKLFEAIGTTYGAGDGSTTFNLPNLTDRFIQGSGTAGTVKAAGLPNITATAPHSTSTFGSKYPTGAMFLSTDNNPSALNMQGGSSATFCTVGLDASRSSSVYGASTTVQPPALTMRYYIKY